jgi:hypothetical protein
MNAFKHFIPFHACFRKPNTSQIPMSHQSAEQMKHLEEEGERKVAELIKTNNITEQTLMNIIHGGNDEFRKMHGRDMTYSEMRSLYG